MNLRRSFLFALGLLSSFPAVAENFQQVYGLALANDTTLQAAAAVLKANEQALPIAIARMVPNLSANYETTGGSSNIREPNFFIGEYNTRSYGITLTQPLLHAELWAQLEGARHQVKSATATYLSATQELIIRVADQYFKILAAKDDLQFAEGSRKSFARTLEQTQQRFDVGLIAITDVQDAKAKHDNAIALEISAKNAVFDQYEILRQITGIPVKAVLVLSPKKEIPLATPIPNDQEKWVATAHMYNLDVIAERERTQTAKAAIGAQVAGHFPQIDLSGNIERLKNTPPFPFDQLNTTKSVTLNMTVPIFAGGGVIFRTTQARAQYEETMKNLEGLQREVDSNTRQSFRGILTAIGRVKALAQAVASNRTSLEARQAAYEVGTRTIVEVLDAETALLDAERQYAKARYQYILEGLRLKQAAGTLNVEDVLRVNAMFY
jgi:outer membrane protein